MLAVAWLSLLASQHPLLTAEVVYTSDGAHLEQAYAVGKWIVIVDEMTWRNVRVFTPNRSKAKSFESDYELVTTIGNRLIIRNRDGYWEVLPDLNLRSIALTDALPESGELTLNDGKSSTFHQLQTENAPVFPRGFRAGPIDGSFKRLQGPIFTRSQADSFTGLLPSPHGKGNQAATWKDGQLTRLPSLKEYPASDSPTRYHELTSTNSMGDLAGYCSHMPLGQQAGFLDYRFPILWRGDSVRRLESPREADLLKRGYVIHTDCGPELDNKGAVLWTVLAENRGLNGDDAPQHWLVTLDLNGESIDVLKELGIRSNRRISTALFLDGRRFLLTTVEDGRTVVRVVSY